MAPTSTRHTIHLIGETILALPLFVTAPLLRRWHMRWGATDAEVRAPMPGDERVQVASFNATRAITIDAPREMVWPWIAQMGYARAGFYAYDLLDNAGRPSADRVVPELAHPRVGDSMPMARKVTEATAFRVGGLDPNNWLLWEKPDSTWAWKLVSLADGRTRLVTRLKQRYPWESPAKALFTFTLLEFGDFPMMRRALLGIRSRAERMNANRAG